MSKFYAVRVGRVPGVYTLWTDCQKQIDKYPKPVFRKFDNQEDAENFAIGISKRPDIPERPEWQNIGFEMARDIICDIKSLNKLKRQIEDDIQKSENDRQSYNDKQSRNDREKIRRLDEKEEKTVSSEPVDNRFNVWIDGNTDGFGSISVYFGPEDSKNYSGMFSFKPPIEKTRVNLSAVVRAVSIILQHLKSNNLKSTGSSLIVHTSSRYLYKAIVNFIKSWPIIPDDKNTDIFKMLQKQLKSTGLRINCVMDKENENMKKTIEIASTFKHQNTMF
jgi:hypothetical protein